MSPGVEGSRAAEAPSLPFKATRPVRICIVRLPTVTSVGAVGQDAVPPIGPAYVTGALLAAGHHVTALDAVGEALQQYTQLEGHKDILVHGLLPDEIAGRIDPRTEVIGVSTMFSAEWPINKKAIDRIREAFPHATIVAGGEHVTAAPEFSMKHCPAIDVCVMGEGEETILDLLDALTQKRDLATVTGIAYLRDGAFVRTAPRRRIRDVDDIPLPAWSLWPVERYVDQGLTHGVNLGRSMPLLGSRGCPYQCTFCSSPQMWTTLWRPRNPELVIEEMKLYMQKYGATNFDFYDLTVIVKRAWIMEFCQLLVREKLNVTWQLPSGTRSEAIDEEVGHWMYRSGCRSMNYAPETGSPEELARIKKKCSLDRMLESMAGARKAGIAIKCNFIFGLPGATWHDVRQTFKFFTRLAWIGVDDIACFPYSPYPGSELFDSLVESGRITLDEDYFIGLLGYTDIPNSISYTDFISSRQLAALSVGGMAFFYSLSWLFRPWRAGRFLLDVVLGSKSGKLSMALANTRRKRRAKKMFHDQSPETVVIALD